jgi:uncharacterized membrane protein
MNALVILLRLLHIILGVLWVGGIGLLTWFIIPAVGMAGPSGGQFMQTLTVRTKLVRYMPAIGGLTVLAGFALFWRDMSVSGGSFAQTRAGMTFSIGGLAALIALIVGGIMMGRSAKELGEIGTRVSQAGSPPSPEQAQRIGALQARMKSGASIVLTLLLIATATMAVARYL